MASETPSPAKRARTEENSWKLFSTENVRPSGRIFGLQDLFAHGFDTTHVGGSRTLTTDAAARCTTDRRANTFHTLRLEHRQGGPMAQHQGEERILLFRSDARAAIAKIIFSSVFPEQQEGAVASDYGAYATVHAKIHVLDVKSQYRGRDLGGLLFSQAISSLKAKYCCNGVDCCDDDELLESGSEITSRPSKNDGCKRKQPCNYNVVCILDAEEDATRHGKLVSFYEHLGCRVRPSKRVQYVNNNDSETYRKVPMQIDFHPPKVSSSSRQRKFSHLVSSTGSFLPVQLVGSLGKLAVCSASNQNMKLDWLVTETSEGIQFRSTHGHFLFSTSSGTVSVIYPLGQDKEDSSELDNDTKALKQCTNFIPLRISDEDRTEGNDQSQSDSSRCLWVLRTCHGTFLTVDSLRQTLACSRIPSFWQANRSNLSLLCTSDTPPRRQHYRKCWKFQTYDYVSSMRSRFLNFSLGRITLIEALGLIHAFPAYPFNLLSSDESIHASSPNSAPSLRTLSFLMAEIAREEGLPDWVQLIALFHELGEVVKVLDRSNTGSIAESIYDWTISSRSRVVGCKIPQRATFSEFRHLNMDEEDSGTYQANCGLDNVFLMWSGTEYMYYLLKHNDVSLPDEAFAMLRYFLLGDWHDHYEYQSLTNANDQDMLLFVQEFDALRRSVRLKCVDCDDLTDEQCTSLWDSYYANIAAKYNCDHVFNW